MHVLDECISITWGSGRGLGPGKFEFFGPAISQGPKNSRIPVPNPLPLPLVMDMHVSKTLCTKKNPVINGNPHKLKLPTKITLGAFRDSDSANARNIDH
jgi:hypothetical protein